MEKCDVQNDYLIFGNTPLLSLISNLVWCSVIHQVILVIGCNLTSLCWGQRISVTVTGFSIYLRKAEKFNDDNRDASLSGRILNLPGAGMRGWASSGPGQLNASAILDEATGKNWARFRPETGFFDLNYCDFACFLVQTYSERVHGLLEHSQGLLFLVMAVDCADFEMVKFPVPRGTGHAFPLFAILPKMASRTKTAWTKVMRVNVK